MGVGQGGMAGRRGGGGVEGERLYAQKSGVTTSHSPLCTGMLNVTCHEQEERAGEKHLHWLLPGDTSSVKNKSFKVRGYQCFRSDRTGRRKGGVLTLVRNNIDANVVDSPVEDSEYQVLKIQADATDIQLGNFYCPISLDDFTP